MRLIGSTKHLGQARLPNAPFVFGSNALTAKKQISKIVTALADLLLSTKMPLSRSFKRIPKVLSRWVPHALTESDRAVRVCIAESLLLRPHRKDLLESIVTVDESWVYYENDSRHAYWIPFGEQAP
ncbi:unnamed protein product [Nippostrongylus brasiliensis]|uniref:Transposase n=1 Tax=Nippostrongylus brasiliensis TaxID=27835 RepID=A0A0N4YIX6_NIPBR|nr:unnamed protein product [Nippostrongylus brasiliensis]